MLATEEHSVPSGERPSHPSLLENWPHNELMRHIPSIGWMTQKLDGDIRRRIEKLWLPYSDLAASDPRHATLEAEFRALCRALERVSDVARRHHRGGHPPNDLGSRVTWTLSQAVASLNAVDPATFGRRLPFQTFERSNAEPLWAAVLNVIQHVQRIVPLVREIEPEIDERLYEGLVQLHEPLRREPMA
ncbi:MAG TPA: hypothetical protein VHK90_00680 [Thermoanaerobaculia bacterium]|nr:hypothetical protein [Thermoanaerobaculia bacterium]